MAEENPFAKYRKPADAPEEENPFAKYRATQPDAAPPQDPTEQMFVPREAVTTTAKTPGELAKYYGEMIPMAADAGTFGMGNRGIAYGRSILDGSRGESYGQNIEQQNKYLKQLRDADPDRAVMSELIGGVGSGAGLARAGITLAKPTAGIISRAIRGGVEGAAQGAAQGAGQDYGTLADKLASAGKGAAMGGTFGTGIPLATAMPTGVKTLFDLYKGNVPKYPPSVLRAAEADRAALEVLPQTFGPEGMLVDTPSMRRVAAGAMTTPGYGATKMERNLRARDEATPLRLREGETEAFGPRVSARKVEADLAEDFAKDSPQWQAAFRNAKAVDTTNVANWLESQIVNTRVAAPELQRVRKALNVHGTDQLDPHPETLHATRELIDEMMQAKDMPGKTARALTLARQQISDELHRKVPGMALLDAAWAEKASRGEAFKRGQEIFSTAPNTWVDAGEWAAEKGAMAAPKNNPHTVMGGVPSEAPKFSEMGTRRELARRVEAGSNELVTLKNQFAPYTDDTAKLMEQFGVTSVKQFQDLIKNNSTFRESYNKIIHGSQTANKIEAAADSERGYETFLKYALNPKKLVGDTLDQAQAGYGASVRNRITDLLATRGDDPTFETLRREILDAAAEQSRKDVTRTILESAARHGGTTAATSPLRITVRP